MTSDQPDKHYLATRQYRDASNLNVRGSLHARFGTNPYPWFRWVFDQVLSVAPPAARILEVGAGPAGFWRENLDRLPTDWQVILTDLSEGMVAEVRAALALPAFDCSVADVETLPFPDGAFDLAIANHMLYHVPDRPKALSELRRVLRPGGALIAATNGRDNMRELDDLIKTFAPSDLTTAWKASFRHPFTLENGAAQLAPFFDQIELRSYDDDLNVTEIEPLVAYVLSIDAPGLRDAQSTAAIAEQARAIMQAHNGIFHITKSVGMFVARRHD